MGYVAVEGSQNAIENAEKLLKYYRLKGKSTPITIKQIQDQLRLLVDRVMSEGGLYSPMHAALAIKQSEGDPLEAAFYVRAYRSTLLKICDSEPINMDNMRIVRRISSAFKDIPGGQLLGPTSDYTQRILDFDLLNETEREAEEIINVINETNHNNGKNSDYTKITKVVDILKNQGLVENTNTSQNEAFDITRESVTFPVSRSASLQMMCRGETGALLALAYSSMRGYGSIHPTIAELRVGYVKIFISHPHQKDKKVYIGEILVTEAEILANSKQKNLDEKPCFTLGYGICFGMNENKAISMAVLDRTMKETEKRAPSNDQEFVLMHIDGIESSGFCAHFKLPHYITFQSDLDNMRKKQKKFFEEKAEN